MQAKLKAASIDQLLMALHDESACVVLGAGASDPLVPLTNRFPERLRRIVSRMPGFPVDAPPPNPVRELFAVARPSALDTMTEWKAQHATNLTLFVVLRYLLTDIRQLDPWQNLFFRWVPRSVPIVCFNWDRLAAKYCPQQTILYPHNLVRPDITNAAELDEYLHWTQLGDPPDPFILRDVVVLPGEECTRIRVRTKRAVSAVWRNCSAVVVIGYSFGMPSNSYDVMWRNLFLDSMAANPVPVHLVSPTALLLSEALSATLRAENRVAAYPIKWYAFASACCTLLTTSGARSLPDLIAMKDLLLSEYSRMVDNPQIWS